MIYKTKVFARLAKRLGITEAMLCAAAAGGGTTSSLGRHLFKVRINLNADRAIYAAKQGHHTFFLFCYEKSTMENVPPTQELMLAKQGAVLLAYTQEQLDNAVSKEELQEVKCPNTTNV